MSREYKNPMEALAADIAGDDYNTSTSLLNGWAGTVTYEKLSNGMVLANVVATTIGTTIAGTDIFTMPVGYRPNRTVAILITNAAGTDGVGGLLEFRTDGSIKVYDFNASVTTFRSSEAVFMARN